MKQLLITAVLIIAAIWIYSIQSRDKRYKFPSDYDYTKSAKIDLNYHDPLLVDQYLFNVKEVGAYARRQWRQEKNDVRQPKEGDDQAAYAARHYTGLIVSTEKIEHKLKQSLELKNENWTDSEIAHFEQTGLNPNSVSNSNLMDQVIERPLKRGDKNQLVMEFQKLLNKNGNVIKEDGIFDKETEDAVLKFQEENGLFQSGIIDGWMWEKLR